MVRKILNLGPLRYLVEKFNYNEMDKRYTTNYVMIRKVYHMNNIAIDDVIMFISISDLLILIDEFAANQDIIGTNLVFLNDEWNYSGDAHNFSKSFTLKSFINNDDIPYDVYNEISEYNSSSSSENVLQETLKDLIEYVKENILEDIESQDKTQVLKDSNIIGTYIYDTDYGYTKDQLSGIDIYPIFSIQKLKESDDEEYTNINIDDQYQNDNDDILDIGDIDTYYINLADIKLDKIKLYHPINFKSQNLFVIMDNYINDTHFIYVSKNLKPLPTNSETEIKINNISYSEYIEILVPNLEDLFREDNYYKENLNIVSCFGEKTLSYLNRKNLLKLLINTDPMLDHPTYNVDQFLSLSLLKQKYRLENNISESQLSNDILYKKLFVYNDFEHSQFTNLAISLYHYSDFQNYIYQLSSDLMCGTINFTTKYDFSIRAYLGFIKDADNKEKISVITDFLYSDIFIDRDDLDINDRDEYAYCKYYNITDKSIYQKEVYLDLFDDSLKEIYRKIYFLKEYLDTYQEETKKWEEIQQIYNTKKNKDQIYEEAKTSYDNFILDYHYYLDSEFNLIPNHAINTIIFELNEERAEDNKINKIDITRNTLSYDDKRQIIEQSYQNTIRVITDNDELKNDDDFINYGVMIATDVLFEHVIYRDFQLPKISLEDNRIGINTFIFFINNIFNSYNDLPEELFIKTTFNDRYSGVFLLSNTIILSKDWIKYLWVEQNHDGNFRIDYFKDNWESRLNSKNINNILNMKFIDLSSHTYQNSNNSEDQNTLTNQYNDQNIFDEEHPVYNFNFIDKLHCITTYKTKDTNDLYENSKFSESTIIFKPIFYQMNELSNLYIRRDRTQNMAIPLSSAYTLKTYKIVINGTEFYEKYRNDNAIIFEVNPNLISSDNSYGKYDLLTINDEYVSTGSWQFT